MNFYSFVKTRRKSLDIIKSLWHNNFVANADTEIFW